MSDVNVAPGGGEGAVAPITQATPALPAEGNIKISEAARALSNWRAERKKQASEPAKAEPVTAAPAKVETPELADEADAAPEKVPGETEEKAEPTELSPIEPPRSWTKDEKEEFATYPREAQEKIARREQDREAALRRSQNEAAEKLKGLTVKEQEAEKARHEYESKLPGLLQTIQEQRAGQFADIKTQADVQKLSVDDPFRYIQWMAHQQAEQSVHGELAKVHERQAKEHQSKWEEFSRKQDEIFAERVPEIADPALKAKFQESAMRVLKDFGFSDTELGELWHGQKAVSFRDARIQLLIRNATKFQDAQDAAKKSTAKPVPPVQRPGVAKQSNAGDEQVQALTQKLAKTGSLRDAQALRAAQVKARRA